MLSTLTAMAMIAMPLTPQGGPQRPPALPEAPRPKITLPKKLWGFAELHAHPASHIGFGADAKGDGGIFWGKPGVGLNGANPVADMPACNADSHYGFDEDPVRKETRKVIIKTLDGLTGFDHGANGGANFGSWPSSQSLIHQQMHITSIRRAYDGGLRFMVASVTDSQMLVNLWTKIGFNMFGNAVPPVDPKFDLESAKRQLDFINRQAAANAGWMRIVTSAAEARQAIEENKLAVVLSLEMDSLTSSQILDLVKNYKVRHVIPIHLTNNAFGGTAVYNDVFNASSNYLNGAFFKVINDPKLEFRLDWPQYLVSSDAGSVVPTKVPLPTYLALGYHVGAGGHKNRLGLYDGEFQKLMKAGLLLDVAHMSENAMEQAIRLGEKYGYPLMNSHTGLRGNDGHAHSERDMLRSHAARLAKLGGVMGLGTEGTSGDRELLKVTGAPVIRFTGDVHEWSRPLPTAGEGVGKIISNLRLTIGTGGDDLRGGGDNADVILMLRNGGQLKFPNINKSQGWGGGVRRTVPLPVPAGTKIGDVVSLRLITKFGGGLGGDNWNVDEVRLIANETLADPIGAWLADYNSALASMQNVPIAFGTDINGFAPQVPFSAQAVSYPITVHKGTAGAPASAPALAKYQAGNKAYDFHKHGLATFGMLPDMIQAVSQKPNSKPAVDALFRSADAVVRMWEKVEAARAKLP